MKGLTIRVCSNPALETYDLYIVTRDETGTRSFARLVFEAIPEHQAISPALQVDMLEASPLQQLADSLWDAGIRARAAAGSSGQLQAQGNHLEDMRALVFNREPGGVVR